MHHPTLDELYSLYELQKPYTVRTPLLYCELLSKLINGTVYIKTESLQKTGAFKFRGALSRLQTLSDSEKEKGLVAYSSGNFARGLATAGRLLNIKVTIVMPADAPLIKIEAAKQQGANVILCENNSPSREEAASQMAIELAAENNYTLLHPFDDIELIKGQASVTLEVLEQSRELDIALDTLVCPVGGGSLVAGAKLALETAQYQMQLCTTEPEHFSGMKLSLKNRLLMTDEGNHPTICDALQARTPGISNFKTLGSNTDLLALSIQEPFIVRAIQLAFQDLKLVLEPSGAIGLAALMQNPELFESQTVCIVASGGNVDFNHYQKLINC